MESKQNKENIEEGEEEGGLKDLKEETVKLEPTTIEELTELKSDIVKSIESKEKLNEENL